MQRNNPCHACQNILSLLSKILLEPPHKHQQQLKEDTFATHTHTDNKRTHQTLVTVSQNHKLKKNWRQCINGPKIEFFQIN